MRREIVRVDMDSLPKRLFILLANASASPEAGQGARKMNLRRLRS